MLEFDDHARLAPVLVQPGNDDVHALGGLRDAVLDGDPGVVRNRTVLEHVLHVLEGLFPGLKLTIADTALPPTPHRIEDSVRDHVPPDVVDERRLVAAVNQHEAA
ncbi:MAG: hypothetical protein WD382_00780 [Halofilum sp. (in: g-proteobacteria)]